MAKPFENVYSSVGPANHIPAAWHCIFCVQLCRSRVLPALHIPSRIEGPQAQTADRRAAINVASSLALGAGDVVLVVRWATTGCGCISCCGGGRHFPDDAALLLAFPPPPTLRWLLLSTRSRSACAFFSHPSLACSRPRRRVSSAAMMSSSRAGSAIICRF